MKILSIESSGQVASVAIAEDDKILGEYSINYKKTHSETLLPMVDEVVRMTETKLEEIDAIAISKGPGSFTGLRIGSATAKGLALALNKPIIPVPTVDGLAFQMWGNPGLICPIMDARRHQVYTGIYHFEGDDFVVDEAQNLCLIEDLVEHLNKLGKPVVFLGDASVLHREYIKAQSIIPVTFAPANLREQSAAAVALLGKQLFAQGVSESAAAHKPDYLRASQAERELGNKAKDFRI